MIHGPNKGKIWINDQQLKTSIINGINVSYLKHILLDDTIKILQDMK